MKREVPLNSLAAGVKAIRSEIDVALRNGKMLEGLRIKLRHAVEDGVRDYSLLDEGWP